MDSTTAAEAADRLDELIGEVAVTHEPVRIAGKRGSAVLVGEEDWRSLQETVHLLSVSGVRETVVEGMATPVDQCRDGLDW